MLAFLSLFLKFYLADRHTDEMRSILEVGSEQLLKSFVLGHIVKIRNLNTSRVKKLSQDILFIEN